MKKIIALVLALVLALSAVGAFAEAAPEQVELNWETVEPTLADFGLTGDFVTFEQIAVKLWVPASMTAVELTQEDIDNGFIAYFLDDDQTAQISVVYVDVSGMSLEEYAAKLPELGATEIEAVTINGLPAISYVLEENDCVCIAFATEAGYILEVTMAPKSVEGADIAWAIVGSSIMAAE